MVYLHQKQKPTVLKDLLSDIIKIDDVLIIVRREGAIIEMKSNSLRMHQKDKWITIGENDGPAHMHIDSSIITEARFIEEQKPDRISYSVQFFDNNGEKHFSTVFAKMYDENKTLNQKRKKLYNELFQKYNSQKIIKFISQVSN